MPANQTQPDTPTEFAFRAPKSTEWRSLDASDGDEEATRAAEKAKDSLEQVLLASLKMEHLVVLAGSGCSLSVGGPSMGDLWEVVVGSPISETAGVIAGKTNYNTDNDNIEEFLSHIEAWLSINEDAGVEEFLKTAKKKFWKNVAAFLEMRPSRGTKRYCIVFPGGVRVTNG